MANWKVLAQRKVRPFANTPKLEKKRNQRIGELLSPIKGDTQIKSKVYDYSECLAFGGPAGINAGVKMCVVVWRDTKK